MRIEWARLRPESTSSSKRLSKQALSEPSSFWMMGSTLRMSLPQTSDERVAPRANALLMLPRRVLISPLWHIMRNGWARGQLGKVLVL